MKIVKALKVNASFQQLKLIPVNSNDYKEIINKTLSPITMHGKKNQFITILPLQDDAIKRTQNQLDFTGSTQPIVFEFDYDTKQHQIERAEVLAQKVNTPIYAIDSGNKSVHIILFFRNFSSNAEEYRNAWYRFYYYCSQEFPDYFQFINTTYKANHGDNFEDSTTANRSNIPDSSMAQPNMYYRQANGVRPNKNVEQKLTVIKSLNDYSPQNLNVYISGITLPDETAVREKKKHSRSIEPRNNFDRVKKSVNLRHFIEKNVGLKFKPNGTMNPCPICGHNDCFKLYDENKWRCFSTEHDSGGTVIDFIMEWKGLTSAEALQWIAKEEKIDLIDRVNHAEKRPLGKKILQYFRSLKRKNKAKSHPKQGGSRTRAGRPSTLERASKLRDQNKIKEAIICILSHSIKGLTETGKREIISTDYVLPELKRIGQFHKDSVKCKYYWFDKTEKCLHEIPEKSSHHSKFELFLNKVFGINERCVVDYILKNLRTEAEHEGIETHIHDLSYYDEASSTLYVNNFNNQFYKLDGDTITLNDNGTDGVLFLNTNIDAYNFIADVDPQMVQEYLVNDVNFERYGILTPEDCRDLFHVTILSYFFGETMQTKPISIFYGPKGSGKSVTLKRILCLIYNRYEGLLNVPKNQRDFEMQLTRNQLAFYDNVDEHVESWFKDGIASAATGYTVQMAQLYSTNEKAEFQARPSIGICTRTANFGRGRDDIPDRSLIFHVKPIEEHRDEQTIFNEILNNRDKILSALLIQLNQVVKSFRECRDTSFSTSFRMADFAKFVHNGFPNRRERFESIFRKMKDLQVDLAAEGSYVYEIITLYLENNPELSGFIGQIYDKLKEYSDQNNLSFRKMKSTFNKQFNSEKANLRIWFDFQEINVNPDGDRPKYKYTIKKKKCNNLDPGDANSMEVQESPLFKNAGRGSGKKDSIKDTIGLTSPITRLNQGRVISKCTVQKNYQLVDTIEKLKSAVRELSKVQLISIDTETTSKNAMEAELVGISISVKPNQGWYIPLQFPEKHRNLFTSRSGDDIKIVLEILKPILEDPNFSKCGHNIMYDLILFKKYGLNLKGVAFDTMIAEHLLIAGKNKKGDLKLDSLSTKYLSYNMINIEKLIGKGKHKRLMSDVPLMKVAEYACEDADVVLQLVPILTKELEEAELWEYFEAIEIPVIAPAVDMQVNGVYIDTASLSQLNNKFNTSIQQLEQEIYNLAGCHFNIKSRDNLSEILYNRLNLPIKKRTNSGSPSTDKNALKALKNVHPIVGKILEYRYYQKLLSTYIEALPKHINQKTGRIHPSFNQIGTETGRYSSSNPNLQNIPKGRGISGDIRKAFRPERNGSVILAADYSQIEIRVVAQLSRDATLIQLLQTGKDLHTEIAKAIFGTYYESASDEEKQKLRSQSKTATFGILYGAGPNRLASSFRLTHSDAEQIIKDYFEKFPGLLAYKNRVIEEAQKNGYVKTTSGRRRWLPSINSTIKSERSAAERAAVNTPIQGTAAEIIKRAMVLIWERLNNENLTARIILQIHDELVFEVDQRELKSLEKIVEEEMKAAAAEVLDLVPIEVSLKAADNWSDAH